MKIALVYDRINKFGGAERVLLTLHQIFPDAPLYTSVYNPKTASWANDFQIIPSFINHFPFAKNNHEYFVSLMPNAFESFDFSNFDIVISVTSAEAKGIITKPHQLHFCYMLTPTRYLWSHTHQYSQRGFLAPIKHDVFTKLRQWDYIASKRPDVIVGISKTVNKRIKKYYRRTPKTVIYPPVNTQLFINKNKDNKKDSDTYLIVSRLVDYKNIKPVIGTFNLMPQKTLNIVGIGRQEAELKKISNSNIHFLGTQSDTNLAKLYQSSTALIFPQEEDFGITAIEAQSAGTPVIAYKKGAATEIVIEHQTGVFFNQLTPKTIKAAISSFKNHTWYDKTIEAHALQFDKQVFMRQFTKTLEESWDRMSK